jgi:hypothetical protein
MDNKVLWFLIYLILSCAVVWGIGAFITFNMLWFWTSWIGRLIGIICLISVSSGAAKEVDDM